MTRPTGLVSRRVFVDTGAYFSLTDVRAIDHDATVQIRDRLIEEHRILFTTNFILAETHALVLNRLGRQLAARVLAAIDASTTTIVRVSAADERRARAIILQYADKDFSLTDATSFAVMERLRIPAAFTLDRNFQQFGLQVMPDLH